MFAHLDLNRDGIVTMDEFKRGVYLNSSKMIAFGDTKIKRFKKKIQTHKKSQDITKTKLTLCLRTITQVSERLDELQASYQQLQDEMTKSSDAVAAASAAVEASAAVVTSEPASLLGSMGDGFRAIRVDIENTMTQLEELDIEVGEAEVQTESASSISMHASSASSLSRGRYPSIRLAMRQASLAAMVAAEDEALGKSEAKSTEEVPPMPPTPSTPYTRAERETTSEDEVKLAIKIKRCRENRDYESLRAAVDEVLRSGTILSSSFVVQEAQELIKNLEAAAEKSKASLAKRLRSDKGSSVFFGHAMWDRVTNLMQGIQLAVNRAQTEGIRPLCSFDFETKEKFTLVPGDHLQHGRQKQHDEDRVFRFIDYAPYVWHRLRQSYGIDDEDYLRSIGPGSMLSNLLLGSLSSLSELGSEGKSGSFFYFTTDGRYMVKTISESEHRTLRSSLQMLYHHMTSSDKKSLLCRIVGQHQIRKRRNGKHDKMFFVVQTNCFNTTLSIDRRYDLKGSWVDRVTKAEKRTRKGVCLKDQDLVEFGQRLRVAPDMARALLKTMQADSELLAQLGIIDYSLLLGIHFNSDERAAEIRAARTGMPTLNQRISDNPDKELAYYQLDEGGIHSIDGKETYFMGIIDTLTSYTATKKLEKYAKFAMFKGAGVSVAHPIKYNDRFFKYMSAIMGEDASDLVKRLPTGWEKVLKKMKKRLKKK